MQREYFRVARNRVANLRRASSQNKMQDQRDHGKDEQQVNQSSSDVKHCETADPCNQQDDEQDCPDTHLPSSPASKMSRSPLCDPRSWLESKPHPRVSFNVIASGVLLSFTGTV
jgi:hypothetical protein